ncbi:rod shape-determining protein RodA [Patescibacteria group bacterium]
MHRFWRTIKKADWLLYSGVAFLIGIGISLIFSISRNNELLEGEVLKQSIAVGIGLAFLVALLMIDYRSLRPYAWLFYGLAILLLILVMFFGVEINGARSWFQVGSFLFQPVEFAKLALIILLASFFTREKGELYRVRTFLLSGLITAVPVFLTVLQPDYGSAFLLLLIWGGLVLAAGVRKLYLSIGGLIGLLGLVGLWQFILTEGQKARFTAFLDPSSDALGAGFNTIQSMIAIGSGGVAGRGLGLGSQSQLNFLPEQQTDFIFAVASEELGLIGAAFILALFLFVIVRCFYAALKSPDRFGTLLGIAITTLLIAQVFINIGTNLGLLPVTGLPLPFVSAGRSSMMIWLALMGIIGSIAIRKSSADLKRMENKQNNLT